MNTPSAKAVIFGFSIQGHSLMEVFLGVIIVILFFKKSFRHPTKPLTEQEIDELCYEWVPEPLIPPITQQVNHEPLVLESAAGPHTIVNGRDVVNFASANYLGLIGHDKLLESCTSALEKYGVGSCGPRGFYGTIDVHLDCETRISKFLGTPGSILYSYGLSTMFSIIPCFCKKVDIIVADEGVHWGIQNGLQLSRSTIVYFKHNDMDSLRNTLESIMKKHKRTKNLRRYIVAEAIYQVTCNTHTSLARFLMLVKLKQNIALLWKGLLGIKGMILSSNIESPIVFLKLEKSRGSAKEDLILLLEEITDRALKEDSLLVVRSKRSVIDKCVLPLGIKLYVSAAHSESDIVKASESIKRLASEILL